MSIKTYLGFTQEKVKKGVFPFVSSHSIPILKKDAYKVEFYPEFTGEQYKDPILVANLPQKVYFQVVSDVDESNPNAKKEGVEFSKAELIEVKKGIN